jgi:predicted nucleic acid-binding protein
MVLLFAEIMLSEDIDQIYSCGRELGRSSLHRAAKSWSFGMASGASRAPGSALKIVPAEQELSELAGELKVVKKMSLADCFAAALAKREKAKIYTGDPEFKTVEREIKIVWL